MRMLLITNLIYGMVNPIIELFIGAYIMRNSSDISLVVIFQLAVYTGIPLTFMINGFLLNRVPISRLYSLGMILSGVSMTAMMSLGELSTVGVFVAGLIMGLSYGFFGPIVIFSHSTRPKTVIEIIIMALKPFYTLSRV